MIREITSFWLATERGGMSPPMSPPSFRLATDRVDHKGIIGVINKVIREITSFWLATDRG